MGGTDQYMHGRRCTETQEFHSSKVAKILLQHPVDYFVLFSDCADVAGLISTYKHFTSIVFDV